MLRRLYHLNLCPLRNSAGRRGCALGLRMRRTRWPAFRSADIEELSIRWSAIRFVREVAIGRPRPAVAFVLEARGRRFAIWAAPKQSYKMAGLLDRRQDGDFET